MWRQSKTSVLSLELDGLELRAHNLNELACKCLSSCHKEWENAMYYLARECLGEWLLSNKVTMKEWHIPQWLSQRVREHWGKEREPTTSDLIHLCLCNLSYHMWMRDKVEQCNVLTNSLSLFNTLEAYVPSYSLPITGLLPLVEEGSSRVCQATGWVPRFVMLYCLGTF